MATNIDRDLEGLGNSLRKVLRTYPKGSTETPILDCLEDIWATLVHMNNELTRIKKDNKLR